MPAKPSRATPSQAEPDLALPSLPNPTQPHLAPPDPALPRLPRRACPMGSYPLCVDALRPVDLEPSELAALLWTPLADADSESSAVDEIQ